MNKKRWGTRDLDEPRPHTEHPMKNDLPGTTPPDRIGPSEERHSGSVREYMQQQLENDLNNRIAPAMKRSRTAVTRYDKNNNGRGD